MPIDKRQRVVGDRRRHVARLGDQLAVADHRRVVVRPAALLMHVPMRKAVLRELAVPQMPLAA